jgi:cobalamin biosynthesis protein CobT
MIDGGEWNKKVFYDQRKHTMKDTAIFVLVDWSGSMMGMKMKFAADAAQRLVWCFDRVLNVPVALAAFSDRQSFCDIGYIKKYNTRGMDPKKIAEGFARFGSYTSGNNDADAVNWAYTQVLRRKESRKILIVCSDGAPAGAWKGHADEALQYCTAAIEKDYRVELYGLGIRDHSVSRYYTNHQVVQDVHDISPALFNMIKDGDKT